MRPSDIGRASVVITFRVIIPCLVIFGQNRRPWPSRPTARSGHPAQAISNCQPDCVRAWFLFGQIPFGRYNRTAMSVEGVNVRDEW
jgi:hypothetical protein